MRSAIVLGSVAVVLLLLASAYLWWGHMGPGHMAGQMPGNMAHGEHAMAGHAMGPGGKMGPGAMAGEAMGARAAEADPNETLVDRGKRLFAQNCAACHGPRGRGGVVNPNSLTETVPRLDRLAERLGLFEPEDAEAVVELLQEGKDLAALREEPPFPSYGMFLAQLEAVRQLIHKGNKPGKKDPNGPEPPLQMPSWEGKLSDRDIDAVVSYLITEYPWDEDEDEEE